MDVSLGSTARKSKSHQRKLVLLVERDDAIRCSLLKWLRSELLDCRAVGAAGLEEALATPRTDSPSVVVVDIAYPDVDGVQTIRDIRKTAQCAHVVALTMSDDPEYCESLACAGTSVSLLIWHTNCELLAMIRRLLTEDSSESENQPRGR